MLTNNILLTNYIMGKFAHSELNGQKMPKRGLNDGQKMPISILSWALSAHVNVPTQQ